VIGEPIDLRPPCGGWVWCKVAPEHTVGGNLREGLALAPGGCEDETGGERNGGGSKSLGGQDGFIFLAIKGPSGYCPT
jgi:hypothetical protein